MMTQAQRRIKQWRESPTKFVYDNFKVEPDLWQLDALEAIGGSVTPRRRLALRACTGPGKSAVLAWIGWHRLACFATRGEHPKGAALSGEGRDNLADNLWSELSKWQSRSPYLKEVFTWTQSKIYSNHFPETWFLSARSYPKDANNEAVGQSLSGLHSKFPFILLDETGGMPQIVGQRAEQIFTGGCIDGLIAQAGNPTSTTGLLYYTSTQSAGDTKVITITADPDDPKRTPRVDPDHARDMITKYGRDNPWVMATILGLFPPGAINTLFGPDEIEKSMRRHYDDSDIETAQKRIGVDVARFGLDSTMLAPRQGLVAFPPVEMKNARTNEIAARLALAKQKWNSEVEFVDDTGGWGGGVIDSMIQSGYSPVPVNFAGKADDAKYANRRAEMWFRMSEWVKRGGKLPNRPQFTKQFTTPTYFFLNGKFQLEPKEQIKKRLGFSPDYADALALTFAQVELPAHFSIPGLTHHQPNFESEYDPFDERA